MFNSNYKALFPSENSEANKTEPLVLEHRAIRKEISDLFIKMNALCSMNENLQQEIKSTASSIVEFPQNFQINLLTVIMCWTNSHLNTAAAAVNSIASLGWKSIEMSTNYKITNCNSRKQ